MKAKKVNENMRFERGLDPKSAMGIGISKEAREAYSAINSRAESLGFETYPPKDTIYTPSAEMDGYGDLFAWNKGLYYLYMYDGDPKEVYGLNNYDRFYVIGYTLNEEGKEIHGQTMEEPWKYWMDNDYKYWKIAFPGLI